MSLPSGASVLTGKGGNRGRENGTQPPPRPPGQRPTTMYAAGSAAGSSAAPVPTTARRTMVRAPGRRCPTLAAWLTPGVVVRPWQTEEELRQKELELERREQAIEYRERKIEEDKKKDDGVKHKPPPNWPKFRPVIYHDIREEIPEASQQITKRVYFAWMSTSEAGRWRTGAGTLTMGPAW